MSNFPPPMPVILASASPRRRELLSRLFPSFDIDVANLDEEKFVVSDPIETAERLGLEKAVAVARRAPDALVIGGDTVVALDDRQLAKPRDVGQAIEMLLSLSGRRHRVISSVALVWPAGQVVSSDVALVTFRELSVPEVQAYVETGEPMDKAGAYAIQGGAAGFVSSLDGDVETVIGLPTKLVAALLSRVDSFHA